MNIDERLQAITMNLELLMHSQEETDRKIRALATIAEQNETRAAKMIEAINR